MDGRRLIESLVPEVAPNASVVAIEEHDHYYAVMLAGTTSVVAGCEVPRSTVVAAEHAADARRQLAAMLKRCADDVVAEVPDGRG